MFYTPRFFDIKELVDEATFLKFGLRAWMFFNPVFLRSLDRLRHHFDSPVTVNNWAYGGEFSQRGLRVNTSVGAEYSQHRFGNAGDYDIEGYPAEEVRQEILNKKDNHNFELITCIETGINWNHHDCRNIPNRILLIKPQLFML